MDLFTEIIENWKRSQLLLGGKMTNSGVDMFEASVRIARRDVKQAVE